MVDNNENINIGIIGYGIIGEVLAKYLRNHNSNCTLFISDPQKGFKNDISNSDVIFVNIHVITQSDNTQDLRNLKNLLSNLPDCPIFIRTTIVPGTTDKLRMELNKDIYFMPEFLSEKTAYEDFCSQPMIFCGETELLKKIFVGKKYLEMSSLEAEITKYAHNVFGALKVTFFNGVNELSRKYGVDYEKIRMGVLSSGYINAMHTFVPGHDGKFGFGGKCFPKDVQAFIKTTEAYNLNKLVEIISELNTYYRKIKL
jgi:UDPglucose 6-dehydrogenase